MPMVCRAVSSLDHGLTAGLMLYTATLFVYLFCRQHLALLTTP